ncbi:MAG TPA: glycosyl hydrolase family 18 protein [Candidatus Angelobacter sp.]|jgi:spore germination protein|nr:glycosyl hydrolase family 18 protein [Candidatus Angelobacter sp.]
MPSPRAGALAASAAILFLLPACAPASSPATGFLGTGSPGQGVLVVTAGGTALVDGQADVPPTLDLRVVGSTTLSPDTVRARLDGGALALAQGGGGAVTASVAPMPLGSAHTLDLSVPDRQAQHFAFHVAPAAGVAAAVHSDSKDGTVLDLAFEFAPTDPKSVEAALPKGAAVTWSDQTHLRAAWPSAPGGSLTLPRDLSTDRGSHLASSFSVRLDAVPPGALRRQAVPDAGAVAGRPLVVAFTVATAASRASLQAHAGRISVASPTGVRINSDGSLSGEPDAAAVAIAKSAGIQVWPLLQNDASDSSGIAALLQDDAAVNRLVGAAAALDFPGLHLDVEGVPAESRDRLSVFVQRLADALHRRGHTLAVAVVPHKPGHLNLYSAAYDLQAISGTADLVTLMAYDEHTGLTDPGPVAGYDWDGQVLAGSLAEMRSHGTALLGLPLYSRAWDSGDVTADAYAASVANALQSPGARVDYDFGEATPSIHYGNGAVLWFDDALSLETKASLVGDQKLHGVALWRLGFEDPGFWATLPANPPRP